MSLNPHHRCFHPLLEELGCSYVPLRKESPSADGVEGGVAPVVEGGPDQLRVLPGEHDVESGGTSQSSSPGEILLSMDTSHGEDLARLYGGGQ